MTLHEDMHDLIERVIRISFQAGYVAATLQPKQSCPERYTDWREHGPGALFPFGKGDRPKVMSPRDTAAYRSIMTDLQELGSDGPEVCTTHLVFAPCRHGGGYQTCAFSTDMRHVRIVRDYQNGELDLVRAHNAIRAYPTSNRTERVWGGDDDV